MAIKKNFKKKNKNHNQEANSDELLLCGKHPIFNAIEKKRRKIFTLYATKNSILELEKFLDKSSLPSLKKIIKLVDNDKIEELVGRSQTHQGLVAKVSKLETKTQNDLLEELYQIKESGGKLPTLLLLDQISDPHNIGAIIRSASAFGVTKIIFCEHNSPKENATIVKASSGTIDLVDLIVVTNFSNLLEKIKKIDYWCVGLAGEAREDISKIKEFENVALIVGSEGGGIRDLVKKNCDFLAKINIGSQVESLNASVASAITLYELSKA